MAFCDEGAALSSSSEQVVKSTGSCVATSSHRPVQTRYVGPLRGRRGRALQHLRAGVVRSV
jgi:hypothetical protein